MTVYIPLKDTLVDDVTSVISIAVSIIFLTYFFANSITSSV